MNDAARQSVIFGCAGDKLSAEEADFFRGVQPWGFILFARNCISAEQITELCRSLRETVEDETAPILIDQEGGRVTRAKPPLAAARPAMDRFGALAKLDPDKGTEAAFLGARLLAEDIRTLGANVNCIPVLDIPQPDADQVIGDRALALHPEHVAQLGKAVIEGSLAGGVLPVIKHVPGHGRALADSHQELPVVTASREELQETDFAPFKALNTAPLGMSCHVVFTAYDPEYPATLSETVIRDVIRGGIGFDGLLMTDDLSMKALGGTYKERSATALTAGCDMLLHCNGDMAEMKDVAEAATLLTGNALSRARKARESLRVAAPIDLKSEEQRFAELLKPVMA